MQPFNAFNVERERIFNMEESFIQLQNVKHSFIWIEMLTLVDSICMFGHFDRNERNIRNDIAFIT